MTCGLEKEMSVVSQAVNPGLADSSIKITVFQDIKLSKLIKHYFVFLSFSQWGTGCYTNLIPLPIFSYFIEGLSGIKQGCVSL